MLALATVLAATTPAQGGLGRGKGGGGGGSPRPSNPGPSSSPSSRPSSGPSRSPAPSRSQPSNSQPSAPRSQPSAPLDRGRDRAPSPSTSGGGTYPARGTQVSGAGQQPTRVPGQGRGPGASRSGTVRYGGSNNATRVGNPFRIDRAPTIVNGNALPGRVYRQDRVGIVNGYRYGYTHYNRGWQDNYFYFPYYTFSPFGNACVVSPFYGYAFVPGYIGYNNVTIISSYQSPWYWQNGVVYNWDQGYRSGTYYNNDRRSDRAARDAVDDLRDGFVRGEPRYLSRLIGRDGQVAILRDGRYDYSVSVAEFDDLIRDLSTNSRTQSYVIEDSRVFNDSIRLVARHNYIDPWGQAQTMFHHILLQPDRGSYVIREFGTSPSRYW